MRLQIQIFRRAPKRCTATESGGWRCEREAGHDEPGLIESLFRPKGTPHWISPKSLDAGFDTSGPWEPDPQDYDDPWMY